MSRSLPRTLFAEGVAVVFDFSNGGNWGREIASVTESAEYQTCTIRVTHDAEVLEAYDNRTNQTFRVSKDLSLLAADLDDDALVAELDLPSGTPVFRVNTGTPVGIAGNVWVRVLDRVSLVFVYDNGWQSVPVDNEVYSGQARFIPVRAGVWQGGEAQLNATTIRAVRFQVPFEALPGRVRSGSIVTFTAAPYNPNLVGRTAKVMDDFQGSTTASRTFHGMMDADSEDV